MNHSVKGNFKSHCGILFSMRQWIHHLALVFFEQLCSVQYFELQLYCICLHATCSFAKSTISHESKLIVASDSMVEIV